jgi:vancomycin resistance protein VanJ
MPARPLTALMPATAPTRPRRWFRRIVVAAAILYPLLLLAAVLVLRGWGLRWWLATVTLYLPRALFALPLPFVLLGLALCRAWKLALTQVASLLILLFPLMGLVLPGPARREPGAPVVRVLSYNVDSGYRGFDKIVAQIDELAPDVVLLQELFHDPAPLIELLRPRYREVRSSGQFLIASRFPIRSTSQPERVPLRGTMRSPRFVQQIIDTPLGPIAFYNVHPVSPRSGFYVLRAGGLKRGLLSGALLSGEKAGTLESDDELRTQQVDAFARLAANEPIPVVIAGDTNLPGLSPELHLALGGFRDGFAEAGSGFGYTFPVHHLAWMRIDRILASAELRFVGFAVGRQIASDHACVVADIQRWKP